MNYAEIEPGTECDSLLITPFGKGSENDHAFRSQAVHWLLHHPAANDSLGAGKPIPKVVVQFWDNFDELPSDVAECMDSWRKLEEKGFELVRFDDLMARKFLAAYFTPMHVAAFDLCYHPAMRCDYFRLCYISKSGGFYVDADEFYLGGSCDDLFRDSKAKLQPLCYDVELQQMVSADEFLNETTFNSNRIYYVNNNPIIAPPNHALVKSALLRATGLLLATIKRQEIQSTTGPGNLSAALVRHAAVDSTFNNRDFSLLTVWNSISQVRWNLSYRNDERNWRLVKI